MTGISWRVMRYQAEIEEDCDTVIKCDGCEWVGTFGDVAEIEDCGLTPGDPSPAGRCPECGELVYIANVMRSK